MVVYLPAIQPADFKLNVLYEEPSLGQKRYLPEGDKTGVAINHAAESRPVKCTELIPCRMVYSIIWKDLP